MSSRNMSCQAGTHHVSTLMRRPSTQVPFAQVTLSYWSGSASARQTQAAFSFHSSKEWADWRTLCVCVYRVGHTLYPNAGDPTESIQNYWGALVARLRLMGCAQVQVDCYTWFEKLMSTRENSNFKISNLGKIERNTDTSYSDSPGGKSQCAVFEANFAQTTACTSSTRTEVRWANWIRKKALLLFLYNRS